MIMNNTPIYLACEKHLPANTDVNHHLGVLTQYPEGEWFAPNNSQNEAFSICYHLADFHIIRIKRTPLWFENSFRGSKIEFYYKKDLCYQTSPY